MKTIKDILWGLLVTLLVFASCTKNDDVPDHDPKLNESIISTIAGDSVAYESVLRAIPDQYITAARENLHIAYQHTSHGTHVSYGLFGLPYFEPGDHTKFAITNKNAQSGKLDFNDNVMASYAASGTDASDLSRNETAFIQATRNYLDDPDNAAINVVMWSWCNIAGHDVENNYLPGMQTLIDEYGEGGSKIGSATGQRQYAVNFIFMTGHANKDNNVGDGKPMNQAKLITDFCRKHAYFCLDYYAIDTHDMDGNYWEDAGDDGNSSAGGNFYTDWQNNKTLNTDYYENRSSPGGSATFGAHNTQHITANRKAFAMWYILARMSGWDGES